MIVPNKPIIAQHRFARIQVARPLEPVLCGWLRSDHLEVFRRGSSLCGASAYINKGL